MVNSVMLDGSSACCAEFCSWRWHAAASRSHVRLSIGRGTAGIGERDPVPSGIEGIEPRRTCRSQRPVTTISCRGESQVDVLRLWCGLLDFFILLRSIR